jgi:hypothetical protein
LLYPAEAGNVDYLITGDNGGLLDLDTTEEPLTISARDYGALFA